MKDNKKSYKNRIVRLMSLILLLFPISTNNNILAFDKDKDMRIMLMPNMPILSPKGDEIAFDFTWKSGDKVGSDIGILSVASDNTRIITKSQFNESLNESPSWTKDSGYILFRSIRKEGTGLFSINMGTLKEKTLFFLLEDEQHSSQKIFYLYPLWGPMSNKIVFIKQIADLNSITYSGNIYDIEDKNEIQIAKDLSPTVIFRNTWSISYDGNYVFYTKKNDKYNDIWLSDVSKNHEERLTEGLDVKYLRASPIKKEILFVTKEKKINRWVIYTLDINNKSIKKIFEGINNYLGFPSWSLDGNSIVLINDNSINVIDINSREVILKLKINLESISFPMLFNDKKIVFYHKQSSIWSVDIEGKSLKKIFPKNLKWN